MNLVSLIIAPIVVEYEGYSAALIIGVAVALVLILWAVRRSDRDSMVMGEVTDRVTAEMVK
jgi:energy-converting hydrogenase Eha subunit A